MADTFAQRIECEHPRDAELQATRVFHLLLQRPPSRAERDRAVRLIDTHGLPALCRAMLNSNEFLTVE
jgi:hypothetical protein